LFVLLFIIIIIIIIITIITIIIITWDARVFHAGFNVLNCLAVDDVTVNLGLVKSECYDDIVLLLDAWVLDIFVIHSPYFV
jgi:hypothetical protein